MTKPILSIDFDGCIHGGQSGWQGPRKIPDPPVPGAMEFLWKAVQLFDVAIFSSRSRYWFARRAMKKYIRAEFHGWMISMGNCDNHKLPSITWSNIIDRYHPHGTMEPPSVVERDCADYFVKELSFPLMKPAAFLTIDDRAIQFKGNFMDPEDLLQFKPWNKQ